MRNLTIGILLLFFVSACNTGCSPTKRYTTSNAHSHNDYLNSNPFVSAYNENYGSIEADVFPVNGVLYVAHKKEDIQQQNTLQALYLQPLLRRLSTDSSKKLNLLIDVKENYPVALSLLEKELQGLISYLSTPAKTRNITISISGNRPPPTEYKQYPGYIFFDDDLKLKHTAEQWQRVNLVSLQFDKITTWNGVGSIPENDLHALKHKIDSVHSAGKPIRFWGAPDTIEAWKQQIKLGADLIGTDKINELANYLRKGHS
jgi:Glycerophosphoryl diester phosphodiesterase family